jgi:CubicO group peptidase (beta-lactamase class C family)
MRSLFLRAAPVLLLMAAGPSVAARGPDLARLITRLEPVIDREMNEGRIPSLALALVDADSVLWTKAYGYANLWSRAHAVPGTVYLIGSTFKAMSTVALLQQMEAGKFRLDDPIAPHLGDLRIRNQVAGQPITFRHLLTHTSGLPGAFGGVPVWSDTAPMPLREYLEQDLEATSPPMDSVRYSNLAFSLVAWLVERFSGVPYKQYIRERVWQPLEMTSTDFNPTPAMDERLAMPYRTDSLGAPLPAVRLKANVWPAGIVYGTVRDQAHWLIMNLNGGVFRGRRLLSEATVRAMQTRQYERFQGPLAGGWGNDSSGYGLTWWTMTRGGDRYIGHSGSVPGYTAFVHGNASRRQGIVILTNGNRAHARLVRISLAATDLLAGAEP